MVSPLELKNKEFSTKLMGYNKAEVDDFLSVVIKDYEALYRFFRKNAETEEDAVEQEAPAYDRKPLKVKTEEKPIEEAPLAGSQPHDRAVMEILEMARQAAEDSRRAASSEAQSVVADAQRKAAAVAADADSQLKAAQRRLQDLSAQEAALRARMKGLLEVYRHLMEDFEATSGIDYNL